ncbi:hypothetical protein Leryth_017303, partial [Lithospermum erythrorhizon]
MAIKTLSHKSLLNCIIITLISSSFSPNIAKSDSPALPKFVFSWSKDNGKFVTGDVVDIKVKILDNFETDKFEHHFCPNITVNEKMGNSSYISWLTFHFDPNDVGSWRISFLPIMVGSYDVLIADDNFMVFDSSLHFEVEPG